MEKEKQKEFKDKIMNDYRYQVQTKTEVKPNILNNTTPSNNDMMNQLFEEKRNIPKEMMAANERRI